MMKKREINFRNESKNITSDKLVPKNLLIRKIDKAINLNFIYGKVKHLYNNIGKASIDPVVLFEIVIIQYLFGIKSMRQTIKEIEVNIAYHWYFGYSLDESIPRFTTFGKNYSHRFDNSDIFQKIFEAYSMILPTSLLVSY